MLAALIVVFSSSTVTAAKLDDNRIGAISQNCSSIKESLRRIESSGAKSRVYLGAQYETIYTGLMSNFSLRLMRNGIANQAIADEQAAFQSERERFKSEFINYSHELEELIDMNCRTEPEKFYSKLEKTREKREKVAESIHRLNEIIKEHRSSVFDIRDEISGDDKNE